jgi:amino acid permease
MDMNFFVMFSTFTVCIGLSFIYRFLIDRQRNKVIMAAIEKGLPVSELKDLLSNSKTFNRSVIRGKKNWIQKISLGVFFLVASVGLLIFSWLTGNHWENLDPNREDGPFVCLFISIMSFALGSMAIVSGLLSRKGEEQAKQIEQSESRQKSLQP